MKVYLERSGNITQSDQTNVNSHNNRADLNFLGDNNNLENDTGTSIDTENDTMTSISTENSSSDNDMQSDESDGSQLPIVAINTNCNRCGTQIDADNNYFSNISDATEQVGVSPCLSISPKISRKTEMGVDNVDIEPEVETSSVPIANEEHQSEANDFYDKLMDYLGEPRASSSVCHSDEDEEGVGLESLVYDVRQTGIDGVMNRSDLDSGSPPGGDGSRGNTLDGTFSDVANASEVSVNSHSILHASRESSLDVSSLNKSLVFFSSEAVSTDIE